MGLREQADESASAERHRNTFAYDADGKRVRKDDSSGTSKFVWDGENILVETNASDVIQVVYTQEPRVYGDLVSQYRSATTSFFHFDALGSTDRLTNSVGTVTDNYIYRAFGIIVVNSGTTLNPLKFVGRHGYFFDSDLLLYLLRARLYDPFRGRFLTPDPVGYETGYVYVENRPVIAFDPSGMRSLLAPAGSMVDGRRNECERRFPKPKKAGKDTELSEDTIECIYDCFKKYSGKKDGKKLTDCVIVCITKDRWEKMKQDVRLWIAELVCCINTGRQAQPDPCKCGIEPDGKEGPCYHPGRKCGGQPKDRNQCSECCDWRVCVWAYKDHDVDLDKLFGGFQDDAACRDACS